MPDRSAAGSSLSRRFRGADGWVVNRAVDWPGECPESIALDSVSGVVGYPALADEGETVGRQVFLDSREAASSHRAGVIRLYRLLNADNIKYMRRNLPLPNTVKLTLGQYDPVAGFSEDLIDAAVYEAVTDGGREEIRTEDAYRRRSAEGRKILYDVLQRIVGTVAQAVEARDQLAALLRSKARNAAAEESVGDIKGQLDFYFRPGFLRFPALVERYPRYFRALRLRTERMVAAPLKDQSKMEQVEWFEERFRLSLNAVADFGRAFDLQEFALALQEWRIAVFAPEVGTASKINDRKLHEMWDSLRL